MSVAARLVGFAAALALIFAGAMLAGGVLDVRAGDDAAARDGADDEMAGGHAGEGAGIAPAPVRGLAVSERGLTLDASRATAEAGERFNLSFRISGRDGATVRRFDTEHTKRMHLIVVRRDMTGFQHLHPTQTADGRWTTPVTLPDPGSYRVFADFSVAGRAYTLATDLTVDGAANARPLPAPAESATADGLKVALKAPASRAGAESELAFDVTRGGRPVAVQDYLGAKGHLVALREGDLAFLHVHPDERTPRFGATFPSAGRYRLFLQFRTGGRVHTVAFTREVAR